MKVDVNNILETSEKLLKSSKKEELDDVKPKDIVDNGEDIDKEVKESEKAKNDAENKSDGDDELTDEERKALESGDYDYDPNYSDYDDEYDDSDTDDDDGEEVKKSSQATDEEDTETDEEDTETDDYNDGEDEGKIEKALENIIAVSNNIIERLEKLESSTLEKSAKTEPLGKGILHKGQILHKDFNTSSGIEVSYGYEKLSKSQKAAVLSEALIKGNTSVTAMDVLRAEQSGIIRDEHRELFINKEEK